MSRAGDQALSAESVDCDAVEVSLSFVSEDEIRALNGSYRDIDRVTDVLSFPQYTDVDALRAAVLAAGGAALIPLGDVVICTARARAQARDCGHSAEREFVYLFVHSLLHLLGYDHEDDMDKRRMRAAEEATMAKVNLAR
jgi:probable rRNA maturation factor